MRTASNQKQTSSSIFVSTLLSLVRCTRGLWEDEDIASMLHSRVLSSNTRPPYNGWVSAVQNGRIKQVGSSGPRNVDQI